MKNERKIAILAVTIRPPAAPQRPSRKLSCGAEKLYLRLVVRIQHLCTPVKRSKLLYFLVLTQLPFACYEECPNLFCHYGSVNLRQCLVQNAPQTHIQTLIFYSTEYRLLIYCVMDYRFYILSTRHSDLMLCSLPGEYIGARTGSGARLMPAAPAAAAAVATPFAILLQLRWRR